MTRIVTKFGNADVTQNYKEVRDRIGQSKDGFIYLTVEGGEGRLYRLESIIYVSDSFVPATSTPQEAIDHSESAEEIDVHPAEGSLPTPAEAVTQPVEA